jgi:hypothetical protein
MEDDTIANEKDGPFMMLDGCDLNLKFVKGLEVAFEQSNCMFRAYMDLAIKDHKKGNKK